MITKKVIVKGLTKIKNNNKKIRFINRKLVKDFNDGWKLGGVVQNTNEVIIFKDQ